MTGETEKQIADALGVLAEKLGTTAEYLWHVLLKQAPVWGAAYFLQLVLLAVLWLAMWRAFQKAKTWVEEGSEYSAREVIWVPLGIAIVALTIVSAMHLADLNLAIAAFANPEYWALRQVLAAIG